MTGFEPYELAGTSPLAWARRNGDRYDIADGDGKVAFSVDAATFELLLTPACVDERQREDP